MNTTQSKKQPPISHLAAVSDEPHRPDEGRPLSTKEHTQPQTEIHVRRLNLWYNEGETHALKDNSIDIFRNHVTAFIGPSGCGKSTFLRCLNRMNDLIKGVLVDGLVEMDGRDVYHPAMDEVALRQRVGMVFQKPNPFPKSVYENIAYAPRMHDIVTKNSKEERELVEQSLVEAGLWDEVKDFLDSPGTSLSGGQQQRLCIARAIAVKPDVILMDEPTSALDPLSTKKVEDLIRELKHDFTIVIVTHNMQQAERISDYTAFFYLGELVEYSETKSLFTKPTTERAKQYISGDYG